MEGDQFDELDVIFIDDGGEELVPVDLYTCRYSTRRDATEEESAKNAPAEVIQGNKGDVTSSSNTEEEDSHDVIDTNDDLTAVDTPQCFKRRGSGEERVSGEEEEIQVPSRKKLRYDGEDVAMELCALLDEEGAYLECAEEDEFFDCSEFVGGNPTRPGPSNSPVPGPSNLEDVPSLQDPSNAIDVVDASHGSGPNNTLDTSNGAFYSVQFARTRKIRVREVSRTTFGNNLVEERVYHVKVDESYQDRSFRDNLESLEILFEDIISRMREGRSPRDLGRIFIDSSDLYIPILIGPMPLSELSWTSIWKEIERRLNSNESLKFDETFKVHFGVAFVPEGGVSTSPMIQLHGPGNCRLNKRTIKLIETKKDILCFARCMAVARAWFVWDDAKSAGLDSEQEKNGKKEYKKICDNRNLYQLDQAEIIQRDIVGLPLNRPISLLDISAFERALGFKIIVVSVERLNKVIYRGSEESDRIVYVLLTPPQEHEVVNGNTVGHYDLILGMAGFLGAAKYCDRCLRSCGPGHRCEGQCNTCDALICGEEEGQQRRCSDCCRRVNSDACFRRHKTEDAEGGSLCSKYHQCLTCYKVFDPSQRATHQCGTWYCSRCDQTCLPSAEKHICHMRATPPKKIGTDYIGIDFECDISGDVHVPIFAAAAWCCPKCINTPHTKSRHCDSCGTPCEQCSKKNLCMSSERCGLRMKMFRGRSTDEQVGKWLFSKGNKGKTVFAHNSSGYDGYFLLNYLTSRGLSPHVIFRGSKLLQIHLKQSFNIRVIDTLCFLPMRLADMSKAFDLQARSKGYFPHFFFGDENYRGPMPQAECYGPDQMRRKDREEFMKWYDDQVRQGVIFDYQRDIEVYCVQDCFIMFEAAMKFRQEILDITRQDDKMVGCDPWSYITLPSLCQAIFKAKFLPEHHDILLSDQREVKGVKRNGKLYVVEDDGTEVDAENYDIESHSFVNSPVMVAPPGGLAAHDTYSKSSIEWLEWMAHEKQISITHALNFGEHRIPNSDGRSMLRFDGYHQDKATGDRTCYSFLGCIWHGCPACFPFMREARGNEDEEEEAARDRGSTSWRRVTHPYTGQTMAELHALTTRRRDFIRSQGFNVVEIWECHWTARKKDNSTIKSFVEGLSLVERLNAKDAFFGGRVNCLKFYYEVKREEKIHYLDFCSLYPYILKNRPMPIFTPTIITENFEPLNKYYGLAKVKILPPTNLYIPVLPVRLNDKLIFPLCYDCALSQRQDRCQCSDNDRAIVGTWATPELDVAVEKGYKVLELYEVYQFDKVAVYDPITRKGGLFASYINEFLKLKAESSGWPLWCGDSSELQDQYITDYESKEGIKLTRENVRVNPAKRAVAKLALNSLWGRFAMRDNMSVNTLVTSDDEYLDLLCNPAHVLKDFHAVNEKILHIEHSRRSGMEPPNGSTNIFIAIFTTMYARLHLFSVLDRLKERVIYFDTDSVIYSSEEGNWNPPVGDFLGDLQSELEPDEHIVKVAAGGPKNYTYLTNLDNSMSKVRGFTLNYENSLRVNFETIVRLILDTLDDSDEVPEIVTQTPSKIIRNKKKYTIYSRFEEKLYKMSYSKRVRVPGTYDTVPYGFRL